MLFFKQILGHFFFVSVIFFCWIPEARNSLAWCAWMTFSPLYNYSRDHVLVVQKMNRNFFGVDIIHLGILLVNIAFGFVSVCVRVFVCTLILSVRFLGVFSYTHSLGALFYGNFGGLTVRSG